MRGLGARCTCVAVLPARRARTRRVHSSLNLGHEEQVQQGAAQGHQLARPRARALQCSQYASPFAMEWAPRLARETDVGFQDVSCWPTKAHREAAPLTYRGLCWLYYTDFFPDLNPTPPLPGRLDEEPMSGDRDSRTYFWKRSVIAGVEASSPPRRAAETQEANVAARGWRSGNTVEEQERVALVSRVLGVTTVRPCSRGGGKRPPFKPPECHQPADASQAKLLVGYHTPCDAAVELRALGDLGPAQMLLFVFALALAFSRDFLPADLQGPALMP
jgi:hypothetical protein